MPFSKEQHILNTTDQQIQQQIIIETSQSEESKQEAISQFVDDFVDTIMYQGQIRQDLWEGINEESPISKLEKRQRNKESLPQQTGEPDEATLGLQQKEQYKMLIKKRKDLAPKETS